MPLTPFPPESDEIAIEIAPPRPHRRALLGGGLGLLTAAALPAAAVRAADSLAVGALPPEIDRIKKRGKLIVAMTRFASPPFSFRPKGTPPDAGPEKLVGSDVKLMGAIAAALDVSVEIDNSAVSFNRVIDLVTNGTADLGVSKLSVTYSRAARLVFSDPYIELRHGILANRLAMARLGKGADVGTIIQRKFAGSIGVIQGSSFVEITRGLFPKATIRELPNWDAVVDAADRGQVDIAYRDELEIKRSMKLKPELALNLRSILVKDRRDAIAIAIPWQSTSLLRFVNLAISRNQTGSANDLLDAYPEIFEL